MQQALQQVQQVCNDSQKKKFSDLFSLLDTNDEPEVVSSGSRRPAGRGSKRTGNRLTTNNSNRNNKQSNKEESEEESSEEEVIIKQRTAKKRRKTNLVGSDSDWKTGNWTDYDRIITVAQNSVIDWPVNEVRTLIRLLFKKKKTSLTDCHDDFEDHFYDCHTIKGLLFHWVIVQESLACSFSTSLTESWLLIFVSFSAMSSDWVYSKKKKEQWAQFTCDHSKIVNTSSCFSFYF